MAEEISRPSPEELLARAKAEEQERGRGKLKIFLGYVAGVGKTYTMLEAARQRIKDTDVVVGYVETHGRGETEALLEGLEMLPRRQVDYRGINLGEMDIDAVLARRPQLALVDELAHSNAPGSRHVKRFQDVEELLEAGIDVYTTLNIQHIESGRNIVAQITGVWVRETVPDSFVDGATEIELVDLPPDELLKRLKEGKVYVPEQIAVAIDKFFQKGNLTALRELTMRTAARHVDEQTLAYMKEHAIRGPWPSGERLLVCITADSMGTRLIRSARRLAYDLSAEWTALHIEAPDNSRLPAEQQDQITETLRLAQRLGAKTATLQAESAVDAIMRYADANNITKIVVAKPSRRRWLGLFARPVADRLIRESGQIDVSLVGGGETVKRSTTYTMSFFGDRQGYLRGLGLVALASGLAFLVRDVFSASNLISLYMLAVVLTAILWGLGPSMLASVVGVFAFDYLFVHPVFAVATHDTQFLLTFLILLGVGVLISYLMMRIRAQAATASRHERETAALFDLSRDLAISTSLEGYVKAVAQRVKDTFGRDVIIFLPEDPGDSTLTTYADRPDIKIDENEMAAARWCFEHQRVVGHGTETLPSSKARYLPLVTARGTIGVMGLVAGGEASELTIQQERLLGAYTDLAAVAIEGILLSEPRTA